MPLKGGLYFINDLIFLYFLLQNLFIFYIHFSNNIQKLQNQNKLQAIKLQITFLEKTAGGTNPQRAIPKAKNIGTHAEPVIAGNPVRIDETSARFG